MYYTTNSLFYCLEPSPLHSDMLSLHFWPDTPSILPPYPSLTCYFCAYSIQVQTQYWKGGHIVHWDDMVVLEVLRSGISYDNTITSSIVGWYHIPVSMLKLSLLFEIIHTTPVYTLQFPHDHPHHKPNQRPIHKHHLNKSFLKSTVLTPTCSIPVQYFPIFFWVSSYLLSYRPIIFLLC